VCVVVRCRVGDTQSCIRSKVPSDDAAAGQADGQNTDKKKNCLELRVTLLSLPCELVSPWSSCSTDTVLGGGIGPEVPDRDGFRVRGSEGLTALLVNKALQLLLFLLLLLLLLPQLLLGLSLC
jgi:hypothetical protein